MFLTFDETSELIKTDKVLHIAGTEQLLRKLPKGNWVGGSTEYFMTENGGVVSDERLFVTVFPYSNLRVRTYDKTSIKHIAEDTLHNGFSIVLIPAESQVHRIFAANAAFFKDMFVKAVVGWVTGTNPNKPEQKPIAVNGMTQEVHTDKAVVLGIATGNNAPVVNVVKIFEDKTEVSGVPSGIVSENGTPVVNIVSIFEEDKKSPVIRFPKTLNDGFSVKDCLIDDKEAVFADYISKNGIDTRFPLIAYYSGAYLNTSFWGIDEDKVNFAAPVFSDMDYKFAKPILDYEEAFIEHLSKLTNEKPIFSCNCIGNFWYGGLEGRLSGDIAATFAGPVTFGEIAYQLVNQTLVYVTIK